MSKIFIVRRLLLLALMLVCAWGAPARGQTVTQPASVFNNGGPTAGTPILNAVSTAGRYPIVSNIGYSNHFLTYTTSAPAPRVWLRLEGCKRTDNGTNANRRPAHGQRM